MPTIPRKSETLPLPSSEQRLAGAIDALPAPIAREELAPCAVSLLRVGLANVPLPASGRTLYRWRILAAIAAKDLSLVKLAEGHLDAVAILAELGAQPLPTEALCGTWAAEAKEPLRLEKIAGKYFLHGRKQWCSGSLWTSHALVTCREGQQRRLALVDVRQTTVMVDPTIWQAVGMANTQSGDVLFDGTPAEAIGGPDAYLTRPGFWQGGAGIAACWWGATVAIAQRLRDQAAQRPNPHALAHLGRLDAEIAILTAGFEAAASWIDANPNAHAQQWALRLRTATELAARRVMELVTTSMGAAAFCKDADLAQKLADLPVFISQSHAEQDWESLGKLSAATPSEYDWRLGCP